MNKHASLVVVLSFVLVFSGLAGAQNSAPSPDFISRITGVIWEGEWYSTRSQKDKMKDQYAEMKIKPDGTLSYSFKNNPPYLCQYVVESENTFSFVTSNGKKLFFALKPNDIGGYALHGNMVESPHVQIIMTKKKP